MGLEDVVAGLYSIQRSKEDTMHLQSWDIAEKDTNEEGEGGGRENHLVHLPCWRKSEYARTARTRSQKIAIEGMSTRRNVMGQATYPHCITTRVKK